MSSSLRVLARWPLALAAAAGGLIACSDSNPTQNNPQAATVTVAPATSSLTTGDTATLTATVKDGNGNVLSDATVTWTSSDTDAAPISGSGTVSAILPDSAVTVTATSGNASGTAALIIAGSTPIPMHEGGLVGQPTFDNGNTASGGHGAPVDSIPCGSGVDAEHYHAHLSLIVNGNQVAIPLAIGMDTAFVTGDSLAIAARCFYWLHAHDRTGIIHVEPSETGHTFTLGNYFDIWGEPLSDNNVAGNQGTVYIYVDGKRVFGDPRTIVLAAHQQITLEVGTRVAPPIYQFPADY